MKMQTPLRKDRVLRAANTARESKRNLRNMSNSRQVTTPSKSALDPWSDESARKDQLADPEIKPIIEFKESSHEKPSWHNITPFHPTTKRY
ncbi:uncharacterized protein TNCV_3432441 [Trichonephila clavipes]|nr:uncharacterized protein TNCV_3432441 [Trichonephila clavipes]